MAGGVTVLEPERTAIEPGVEIGSDTVIHPDVSLSGTSTVGTGCSIHQGVVIRRARSPAE